MGASSRSARCMFFNFALAHLFRSINTFWFYLGTLVAVLLVLVLRRAVAARVGVDQAVDRRGGAAARPARAQLHPARAAGEEADAHRPRACTEGDGLRRAASSRRAGASGAPRRRSSTARGGERVYCFTSVFVPNGIHTTIRHRWERIDANGDWGTRTSARSRSAAAARAAIAAIRTNKTHSRPLARDRGVGKRRGDRVSRFQGRGWGGGEVEDIAVVTSQKHQGFTTETQRSQRRTEGFSKISPSSSVDLCASVVSPR